mgnify:CR=1 FL=1
MKKKVGIRFKTGGKVYDFSCGAFVLNTGDQVIVETEKGLGYGVVAVPPVPFEKISADKPLKKVFRIATEDDHRQVEKNIIKNS